MEACYVALGSLPSIASLNASGQRPLCARQPSPSFSGKLRGGYRFAVRQGGKVDETQVTAQLVLRLRDRHLWQLELTEQADVPGPAALRLKLADLVSPSTACDNRSLIQPTLGH
jgi:hypothetical protein